MITDQVVYGTFDISYMSQETARGWTATLTRLEDFEWILDLLMEQIDETKRSGTGSLAKKCISKRWQPFCTKIISKEKRIRLFFSENC